MFINNIHKKQCNITLTISYYNILRGEEIFVPCDITQHLNLVFMMFNYNKINYSYRKFFNEKHILYHNIYYLINV